MRSDYGNLRRRTSDASWQWLLMGTILGLGFALVACVGGYALGALSFPMLEEDTATPHVQNIEPNQTEVALQALAAQQTLEAAQEVLSTPVETDTATDGVSITPSPSPLPTVDNGTPVADAAAATTGDQNPPAVLNPTATVQPTDGQTAAVVETTPVVGTTPVEQAVETAALTETVQIAPELDAIKTAMVPVTGGTFIMGTNLEEGKQAMDECAIYGKTCTDPNLLIADSIPPHETTVDSFEMEIYEVTLSQYVTFLNTLGPNQHRTACGGTACALTTVEEANSVIEFDGTTYSVRNAAFYENHPVTYVTWAGAVAYCEALNRRLPTEAEWERAARGSQNYIYPWGFEFDTARAMSSINENAGTVPVDTYDTNGMSPYGVYDMAGNVSEWVQDWYQEDYYNVMSNNPQPNPQGPSTGTEKVIRGGSWDTIPLFLRAVHRMSQQPDAPNAAIGFRCVSSVSAAPTLTAPTNNATTGTESTTSNGAPTMAPAPTQAPLPTSTPAGPTATLAPG